MAWSQWFHNLKRSFLPPATFPSQAGGLYSRSLHSGTRMVRAPSMESIADLFGVGKRDYHGEHAGSRSIALGVTCIHVSSQIDSYGQLWHQWGKEIQPSPREEEQIFGKFSTVYGIRYECLPFPKSTIHLVFAVGRSKKTSEREREREYRRQEEKWMSARCFLKGYFSSFCKRDLQDSYPFTNRYLPIYYFC